VTVAAATVELGGARLGHSLFLTADAVHLLAHVGIFAILLVPPALHPRGEDVATIAVLVLVAAIALAIAVDGARTLAAGAAEPPAPGMMLLSLLGLAANVVTAWLLTAPARRWWAFRAAIAHELSDGALTVAGLVGAAAIATLGWTWIDPALSLAVGCWLGWWALRLLGRRLRHGADVWAHDVVG
jgi:cobalt-zinc-cadmium efflux system protein